jgi:hypothetical protein
MLSNRLAFAALAVACIGAAAGGGYLATRQNVVPAPASAEMAAPAAVPAPALTTAEQAPTPPAAVQETEAVVGDRAQSAAVPAPVAPAPRAAASRNADAGRPAPRASERPRATPPPAPAGTVARQEQPPPLTSSWPSSASTQPAPPVQPALPAENPVPQPEERTAQEPATTVEPPQKTFEELIVSADSVIGLQTENRITSETARIEDRVEARVTRDVKVGDRIAIPAGARALGSVMQVERGGKFKERARLGIRFHTLVLADGTRVPISTETIYRDGEAPGNSSAAKVGGAAVGGAILGAILGGAKGAVIGSTAGAGAGTAAVMAGDRNAATLPAGTPMTVRLLSPVTVTKEE